MPRGKSLFSQETLPDEMRGGMCGRRAQEEWGGSIKVCLSVSGGRSTGQSRKGKINIIVEGDFDCMGREGSRRAEKMWAQRYRGLRGQGGGGGEVGILKTTKQKGFGAETMEVPPKHLSVIPEEDRGRVKVGGGNEIILKGQRRDGGNSASRYLQILFGGKNHHGL